MSYILDALKKAQAERQLGSAPTIHALPIQAGPLAQNAGSRTPLWIALALGALVLGGGAVFALRQSAPPAAPAPVVAMAATPVVPPVPPLVRAAPEPAPKPRVAAVPKPVPAPKPEPKPEPKPAPVPAEEHVPALRELPEGVQREVPPVAIGGYIYSKNPADRLLLIDKILRREGEEVAPGLTLEKLLPKEAVMNYRGYRYRVAY